jgi:hypothetical protein
MGNDPGRDHTVSTARGPACGHPATWAVDHTQKAEKGDQYAARHDGFTFFRSVTANQAFCAAHIVSFRPLPGIGAVLLSPLIRPGTVSTVACNHYSLPRSIEDIFGLPHLGDAAMPQVRSFGPDVFG